MMEAIDHFKVSFLSAPVFILLLYTTFTVYSFAALFVYAVAVGVLIDLDHFLIARTREGSWKHFVAAVKDFRTIVTENEKIIEGAVSEGERLLSHLVLMGIVSIAIYQFDQRLGLLTLGMLGVHIAVDIYSSRELLLQ